MGLCYSLRPLLFGDPEDVPRASSEAPAEDARPGPAPGPAPVPAPTPALAPVAVRGDAAPAPLPPGAGGSLACARPKAAPKKERRRRPEQLRDEEREAEREARKVSRGIDRMLREQKRDLQQTHRLLLLEPEAELARRAPQELRMVLTACKKVGTESPAFPREQTTTRLLGFSPSFSCSKHSSASPS